MKWAEQPIGGRFREVWEQEQPGRPLPQIFYGFRPHREVETLHAILSRDEIAPGDERWHLSVTARGRVPTWDELAGAAHDLRPGVPFVAGVPPRSWWINIHEHCLHLWEMHDDALTDQWRSEALGHVPTSGAAS